MRAPSLMRVPSVSAVMDIEMVPPEAPSTVTVKRGLSPLCTTNTTKRAKHDLPLAELTSLNANLNRWSKYQPASGDATEWLSMILIALLTSLAKTTAKDSFISPFLPDEADRFVESFNPDERREWVGGIKTCMESGDWSDLITHRMYAVASQDVYFTTATARLHPVAITPNKANLSSETSCLSKRFCR